MSYSLKSSIDYFITFRTKSHFFEVERLPIYQRVKCTGLNKPFVQATYNPLMID